MFPIPTPFEPLPTAESDFSQRLAKLNSVALALTYATSLEAFWRAAIELGVQQLGFAQMTLWRTDIVPNRLYGTFRIDAAGNLRDERSFSFAITEDLTLQHYIQQSTQREPGWLNHASIAATVQPLLTGLDMVVGIWNEQTITGYLFVGRATPKDDYTIEDQQILARYATTLGHLCTHFYREENLTRRRSAADLFLNQMAGLSQVVATLTRSTSFDELCYQAIDLGRRELGFDRLGLWFTTTDPKHIVGSYGTDEAGIIRDERQIETILGESDAVGKQLNSGARYAVAHSTMIPDLAGNMLESGWNAAATLWNGTQITGYLFTDNLLTKQPYSENRSELLALYALLLGHLCTRQKIEEALREREASYRTLIDAIPDYLFLVTRAGLVLDYHEAQPNTLALPLANLVGSQIHEVVYKKAADQYMAAIEEAFATGNLVTFEYPLRHEKNLYHLEVRVTAGNNEQVIVLLRDVTARKVLEEQLSAAQKMESLGRMAGGIAHDFNNLLTVIQGFASVANTLAGEGPTRLRTALERILLASEKGARLTNQLLLFARKKVVRQQALDVHRQIQSIAPLLAPLLGEQIELTITCDAAASNVLMDPGQFEQIIMNLVVNACDAMVNGGYLSITTANVTVTSSKKQQLFPLAPGVYLQLQVSDTGIGMPEEIKKQIFEPFFTTKVPRKGTGLGLAICHGIVQQNRGHIEVESGVDQGTTFSIYLPVTEQLPQAARTATTQGSSAGTETILLVEDDESVRAVTLEVLSSQGYQVLEHATGQAALQTARTYAGPINLLVTDLLMPHMSGREVAEQFLKLRPGIPILLISGYAGELPQSLVDQPNVHFLPKPYTQMTLTEAVRNSIGQPSR